MKNLLPFILKESPKILAAAVIGGLSSSMAVGLLACSAWLISMASQQPPILVLEVAIVAVRFFGLGRGVLRYAARLVEHTSALRMLTTIRVALYRNIEAQLPQFFSLLRRGNVLRKLVADSENLQDLWLRIANPWIGNLIAGLAGLGIIFGLLPKLGLIISLIFLAALFLIPFLSMALSISNDQQIEETRLFDAIVQASDSVHESLVFGYQSQVTENIALAQRRLNQIDVRSGIATGLAIALTNLATGVSIVIAAVYAINAYQSKNLAGVNVAVVTLLPLVIFDGFSGLPAAFARIATVRRSAKSVDDLLGIGASISTSSSTITASTFTIEFDQVIPYLPETSIRPYSGIATPGNPLIITGKSGAGKSSLIHSLMGFLSYSGSIAINGIEAREIDSSNRIDNFAILLQQDHLFATSIRENMRIGNPEVTDEEIFEALEVVELTELVKAIGPDTHIGAYGHNFSGGEKQRLKLARTLLRDRPVVILDEPFEYLPADQASRISRRVFENCSSRTLIVISHLPIN